MQASLCYRVGMKPNASRQYTLRNVPDYVDHLLRQRASETGKSLNQVALEALIVGSGSVARPRRDFSELIGTISSAEANELDHEIRQQRQIDHELWS